MVVRCLRAVGFIRTGRSAARIGNPTKAFASSLCVHGSSLPLDVSWYKNGHPTHGSLTITLYPSATVVISGATSATADVNNAKAATNVAIRDIISVGMNIEVGDGLS